MDTFIQQPTPLEQFSCDLGDLIDALTATGEHLHRLRLGRPNDDLMADWRQTIQWLRELSEHGLKLAVLGSFSSGKSTLINSLLDVDCLTVGVQATTATVTRIRRSQDGQNTAEVQYKSARAMLAEIEQQVDEDRVTLANASEQVAAAVVDAPAMPDIDRPALDDDARASAWLRDRYLPTLRDYLAATDELGADLPATDKPAWRMGRAFLRLVSTLDNARIDQLGGTETVQFDGLAGFVADETRAVCIDEVRLALDAPFLSGDLEILDTPGLGSVHSRHTRRAKEITKAADLVAYVFPDRGPADGDLQFLAWMHEVNKVLDTNKVFWIVNMVDKCIDEDAREDPDPVGVERCIGTHQDQIAQDLQARGFASARVFPVSAECARLASAALTGPDCKKASRRLLQRALWFGDAPAPDPQANLRLSGMPALASELRRYLADHGVRLRRDAARQRCIAWSQAVAQDGEQRSALAKLNLDQLLQLHEQVRGLRARVESGSSSEKARTERSLRQLVKESGCDPLVEELELVIENTAARVAADWDYSWKISRDALFHLIKKTRLVKYTFGEGESALEQDIDSRVRSALTHAIESRHTHETFATIYAEMREVIREEINQSLHNIQKDIGELEVRDEAGRSFFAFRTGSTEALDEQVIDATLDHVGAKLANALGIGGSGAAAISVDFLLFGGFFSIIVGIFAGIPALISWLAATPEVSQQSATQKFQNKVLEAVQAATPEAIKKAIEEPMAGYTQSLLDQYRGRVEQILNNVETRVKEARQSVDRQATERDALEKELNDAARQLLALEHRCAELMPASMP